MTLEEIIEEKIEIEKAISYMITDFNVKIAKERVYIEEINIIRGFADPVRHANIKLVVK